MCIAAVKKSNIGSGAHFTIGDQSFQITIPEANVPVVSSACAAYLYNVFDYGPGYIPDWGVIGTVCQSTPAAEGDEIFDFYNPYYDDTYDYVFGNDGGDYCATDLGSGYYYDDC